MRRLWLIVLVALCVGLLPPMASAKGPAEVVIIEGAGFDEPLEISSPALSRWLSMAGLEAFLDGDIPAPDVDEASGITLSRGFYNGHGEFELWDRVIYYPAADGSGGYVHYLGLFDNQGQRDGWTGYDDNWYMATWEGDQLMRHLLATQDEASANLLALRLNFRQRFMRGQAS